MVLSRQHLCEPHTASITSQLHRGRVWVLNWPASPERSPLWHKIPIVRLLESSIKREWYKIVWSPQSTDVYRLLLKREINTNDIVPTFSRHVAIMKFKLRQFFHEILCHFEYLMWLQCSVKNNIKVLEISIYLHSVFIYNLHNVSTSLDPEL